MQLHESKSTFASRPASGADYAKTGTTSLLRREQACRLLPALVGRMCLEIYDRDWVPELPHTLWETVAGTSGGHREFRVEEVALFRMLAQVAGGWVRHDSEGGLEFISRDRWLRLHGTWKRSSRPQKRRFVRQCA
jgi:hypothetical protein